MKSCSNTTVQGSCSKAESPSSEPAGVSLLLIVLLGILLLPLGASAQWIEATLPQADEPNLMVWNVQSNKLYVAHGQDVEVFDCLTNARLAVLPVGFAPVGMVYNSTNNQVYVSSWHGRSVTVIDGEGDVVAATIPLQTAGCGIEWSRTTNRVYATETYYGDAGSLFHSNICVVDCQTNQITGRIQIPGCPDYEMAWNPVADKLYLSESTEGGIQDQVDVLDCATNQIVARLLMNGWTSSWAVNPTDNKVYVACFGAASGVAVIDGTSNQVIATVSVGGRPLWLTWNSRTNRVYCSCQESNEVVVIDGASNQVVQRIPAGAVPGELLYNATNDKIYCCTNARSVIVIDGATNRIERSLSLTYHPSQRCLVWNHCHNRVYLGTKYMGSGNVTVIRDEPKQWAVLVFMNGDNNLESAAIDDVNEMEQGIRVDNCHLVVQLDRIEGYDNSNGDWRDTRRFLISPDNQTDNVIRSVCLDQLGELNMGSGDVLAGFVGWARQRFFAQRYCIICWDHGSGWHDGQLDGFSDDWTDDDQISVAGEDREYHRALSQIGQSLGHDLDLLCFDACMMGMVEVEWESRDYVRTLVHSEYLVPGDGYPYDEILGWLGMHPEALPVELAQQVVQRYGASYRPGGSQYPGGSVTLSAVSLGPSYLSAVDRLNYFAAELVKAGGRSRTEIASARSSCQHYNFPGDPGYIDENVDISDFARQIQSFTSLPAALRSSAQRMRDAVTDPFVLANERYSGSSGRVVDNSYGVAAHYPSWLVGGDYLALGLCGQSLWDDFLRGASQLPPFPVLTYGGNSRGDLIGRGQYALRIGVRNFGGAAATGVCAELLSDDAFATVIRGVSAYPDIQSESTAWSAGDFVVELSDTAPHDHRVDLSLRVAAGSFDTTSLSFGMIIDTTIHAGVADPKHGVSTAVVLGLTNCGPSPFSGRTSLSYSLPKEGLVSLKVCDLSGRTVRTLANGWLRPGVYSTTWDGRDARRQQVADGIYFCKLRASGEQMTRKLVLQR